MTSKELGNAGSSGVSLNVKIYTGTVKYTAMGHTPIAQLATFPNWIGNLFFLQEIRFPTYGSNGPMWSLSYEGWYYVVFPLLVFGLRRSTASSARIGYLIGACLILLLVGKAIAIYFIIWLMGAAISKSGMSPVFRHVRVKVCASIAFLVSLFIARFHLIKSFLMVDFMVALTFTAVLLVIININPATVLRERYIKMARFFSGISYTLYLVHVPFLVFINAWIIMVG